MPGRPRPVHLVTDYPAGRFGNTSRSKVGRKGGESGSYDDWTVTDLRKRAGELDIEGRSSMSKGDLVSALRHH